MTPLNEVLSKDVDPRAIEAGWERIRARRERPAKALRRLVFVVPALAVAALLVLVLKLFVLSHPGPEPIALAGGAPLPEEWSTPAPKVVALDDGSKLEIDAQAKLRPTPQEHGKKIDPTRVELTLDSGATTFDVKPNGPRVWVIDAGDVVVRVLGTRFRVERSGGDVDVKVERGKVSVEGARVEGGPKLLVAGESIHVGAAPAKHAVTDPKTLPPVNAPPPTIAAAPTIGDGAKLRAANAGVSPANGSGNTANANAPGAKTANTNAASVKGVSANGGTANANPSSTNGGGVTSGVNANATSASANSSNAPGNNAAAGGNAAGGDATPGGGSAAPPVDPMTSADAARRSGKPRDAVAILSGLIEKKDARAPLAAFTLGKIHAEDLGDHATAAVWFERAIAFGLPRGLDEEAHARAVESHAKAGRRTEAARAAARYEASFPNGRHLERVRSFVRN